MNHAIRSRKSLDTFGDKFQYTNQQYVTAFREFSASWVSAWTRVRSNLKTNHPATFNQIIDFVREVGVDAVREVETRTTIKKQQEQNDFLACVAQQLNLLRTKVIMELDDPLLNHLAFKDIIKYRVWPEIKNREEFTTLTPQSYLHFCEETPEGWALSRKRAFSYQKTKTANVTPRIPFSILDLIGLTHEEHFCFYWMMAIKRIQTGNLARLQRTEVEDGKGLYWIRSLKKRGKKQAQKKSFLKRSEEGRFLRNYLETYDAYVSLNLEDDPIFLKPVKKLHWHLDATPNFDIVYHMLPHSEIGLTGITTESFKIVEQLFPLCKSYTNKDKNRPTLSPTSLSKSFTDAELLKSGDFNLSNSMKTVDYAVESEP